MELSKRTVFVFTAYVASSAFTSVTFAEESEAYREDYYIERSWFAEVLIWIFTYVIFPVAVITLILAAANIAFAIIGKSKSTEGRIRRSVGAGLPVVLLAFMVAFQANAVAVAQSIFDTSIFMQIGYGAIVAVCILEFGKQIENTQADAIAAIYLMLVSATASFIVWSFTVGILTVFTFAMLGFLIASALHVIFRGPLKVFSGSS